MSRVAVLQDALRLILLRNLASVRRHIVLVVVGATSSHEIRRGRLVQLGAQVVARLLVHVEDREFGVTVREAVAEEEFPLAAKESVTICDEAQREEQHEQDLCCGRVVHV